MMVDESESTDEWWFDDRIGDWFGWGLMIDVWLFDVWWLNEFESLEESIAVIAD